MSCGTCVRIRTRDEGVAAPWDAIIRTACWDVVHSYDTSLLGWLVLVPRRHMEAMDELTAAESAELAELLRCTTRFLKAEVDCQKTYLMQFTEHPEHPHVHFHVVPRARGLPAEFRGAGIFHYLGVPDEERISERAMNALAEKLCEHWQRFTDGAQS